MAGEWLEHDIIVPASEQERDAVRTAQRALRLRETGDMDNATKVALRGAQRLFGLPPTAVLDKATAQALDRLAPPHARE